MAAMRSWLCLVFKYSLKISLKIAIEYLQLVRTGISEYLSEIHLKTKHLHEWGQPFNRLDSDSCKLWHIPNNTQLTSSPLYNVCRPCKQLHHDIQQLAKRATDTFDAKKQARTSTSNYGLKYLSPTSQKQRITRNI